MANGGRFNFLKDLIKPKKATAETLGSGLAAKAAGAIVSRKDYNDYSISEQEAGNTPMSFEEYKKSKGA
jgi:hypothetical protein